MTRQTHTTPHAPPAIGAYSQAVSASGTLFFMSGQIALRENGVLVEGDAREQTRQIMANIKAVLESAGLTLANVVKTTIFLSSMEHFAIVNDIYGVSFPHDPPARSTVAVLGLPRGVDVEIEALAVY